MGKKVLPGEKHFYFARIVFIRNILAGELFILLGSFFCEAEMQHYAMF